MIPEPLRNQLSEDPFYKKCCITGHKNERIEFHHNLIFAGKQVNRKFCILPLLQSVHRNIVKYREKCDWIMWNRATREEREEFSKAINIDYRLGYLNEKYGEY